MRGSGVWEPGEKEWSMHTGTAERVQKRELKRVQKKRQILMLVMRVCDSSTGWGYGRTEVRAYLDV